MLMYCWRHFIQWWWNKIACQSFIQQIPNAFFSSSVFQTASEVICMFFLLSLWRHSQLFLLDAELIPVLPLWQPASLDQWKVVHSFVHKKNPQNFSNPCSPTVASHSLLALLRAAGCTRLLSVQAVCHNFVKLAMLSLTVVMKMSLTEKSALDVFNHGASSEAK